MFRIFILSPAHCGGKRAGYLLGRAGASEMAQRLRAGETIPIGDVYSFISGLYFRGKMAYAERFGRPPEGVTAALTITPNRGIVPVWESFGLAELRRFAKVDISLDDPKYYRPLRRDLQRLCGEIGPDCEVVLLGSIATAKYIQILSDCLGERVKYPVDFIGRGDLSRGGLMLRAAEAGVELEYAPVDGVVRRGKRPPKLGPKKAMNMDEQDRQDH